MQRRQSLFAFVMSCAFVLVAVSQSLAQINTATLSGAITDQQGLAVHGARITAKNEATGAERSATADEAGHYTIVGLVPGVYKFRVDGGSNFAPYEKPSVQVLVGTETIVNATLVLGTQTQTVTVTTESAPIETTRSESAQTVEQLQIDNLPINGRNYINFTLLNSQTTRDMSPTIGPAPNSGLSISGARARGNMVSVDGADAVDNSVNAIRSTVSQEAVQEFQMILSNYNPEYGRASGGVINIVTKSGSNDFHGDVYGYLRNKAFQARNPFSGEVNADGELVPVKQAYTRVQTGLTAGGAIKKDKTFYFFSYEYTQREETGFSSIGQDKFGVTTGLVPCIPAPLSMTPSQLGFYQGALGLLTGNGGACTNSNPQIQAQIAGLQQAAVVTGATTNVAVNGDLNKNVNGTTIPMTTLLGLPAVIPGSKYFPNPVPCPVGQQVNSVICLPNGQGIVPLPASYVALDSLRGNFPIMEKTSLYSARIDQRWNSRNTSFIRAGVSPSQVTGIQSTSQNQVFGQNAGSRVGASHYRDVNVTFQHDTILSDTAFNEFRFQFARRGLHFGFSPLEGGSDLGVNIPGYAYFGREPYSTVDRIERRYQFTDSGTITHGRHTFKVGADFNLIQLRSSKQQIFELDFGGDATFGSLAILPSPAPAFTGLQTYGFGIPTEYIQGIGTSNQPFNNIPIALFAQDSWRVTRKLTLNYGVRYDLELTPLFAPATPTNAAAEQAQGVIEGLPRDYTNVAPRIGLAWDPIGDGKTVVRAGYGLFYDHPLLAIAFDSTTADGGRSVQLLSGPGIPSACGLVTPACGKGLDSPANLNGASIFMGALNALPNMFYLPNQQRFDPFPQNSIFANQNYLAAGFPLTILPFTLPVQKNFKYGYAQQANLTVERVIKGTWKISAGYQWTRGIHLYRPIDLNSTDPQLLSQNMLKAIESGLSPAAPTLVAVPVGTGIPGSCVTTGANSSMALIAPGALGLGYAGSPSCTGTPVGYVGTPAVFNYFRPSGPNPSFGNVYGGYSNEVALAHLAGFPVGFGVPVPYNSVDAQVSDASSWYNALTINLQKSFSKHFELLSSYTWSHSIDNGTDLQSTLEPQDSRFPQLERSNSVNDQPNRWVTSAVFQTSPHVAGEGFAKAFFSDFTVAPVIEVSSGRPFQVITGADTRLDLSASNDRPSIAAAGTAGATTSPFIHGVAFVPADLCLTNAGVPFTVPASPVPGLPQITPIAGCDGNLSRNRYFMSGFFQFDLRISKGISLGEHLRMDLIADGFNLFNHTNISAVNQLCDPTAGPNCPAGQPTAAYDARQFQFALRLNW
jgi:hypothetical protein